MESEPRWGFAVVAAKLIRGGGPCQTGALDGKFLPGLYLHVFVEAP
jgi:hypothetical protein